MRRDPAPEGRVDAGGRLRVVVHRPSTEGLLTSVLDSVRLYRLDRPAVVPAGLDLAWRLGSVARAAAVRQALTRDIEDLLTEYRANGPDVPDLRTVDARGREVQSGLRAAATT